MEYIRVIRAKWSQEHIDFFRRKNINLFSDNIVHIKGNKLYDELLKIVKETHFIYNKKTSVVFTSDELDSSPYFLLTVRGPELTFPLRRGDDGLEYLRYAFEGVCNICNLPLGEQKNPIVLQKEVKLGKKYLFGTHHFAPRAVLTDYERYRMLKADFDLEFREVLVGKNKKISKNIVQILIPESKRKIEFGNSYFGNLADSTLGNATEELPCKACGITKYTNSLMDYFPKFKDAQLEDDIVFTQEWFGWFHHLLVSRNFANYLEHKNMINYDSHHLYPVKEFV